MTDTTIRIAIEALPSALDRSRLDAVAESIEAELVDAGLRASVSNLFSHIKVEVPTSQLAAAVAVLVDLGLLDHGGAA